MLPPALPLSASLSMGETSHCPAISAAPGSFPQLTPDFVCPLAAVVSTACGSVARRLILSVWMYITLAVLPTWRRQHTEYSAEMLSFQSANQQFRVYFLPMLAGVSCLC